MLIIIMNDGTMHKFRYRDHYYSISDGVITIEQRIAPFTQVIFPLSVVKCFISIEDDDDNYAQVSSIIHEINKSDNKTKKST